MTSANNTLDLALKREDTSKTFVTESKNTSEKPSSKNEENNNYAHSAQWDSQRISLIDLLRHINKYDTDLNLRTYNKIFVSNTGDRINYLRFKIESSPELYRINDWAKGAFNRERIINLQALFSELLSFKTSGETARYEGPKFAITDNCWEQMSEFLEVAESIPHIGKTWLAPVLVLLSKFPYYQSYSQKINKAHYKAIDWPVFDPFTIGKQINPLRRNILNDSIIPENMKLIGFFWIIDRRAQSFLCGDHIQRRKLLANNLTNKMFIDDDKWNSHIENILSTQIQLFPTEILLTL